MAKLYYSANKQSKQYGSKQKKTKHMPIENMPQEFLSEERDPVDFDAPIRIRLSALNKRESATSAPCITLVTMKQADLYLQTSKMLYAVPFISGWDTYLQTIKWHS